MLCCPSRSDAASKLKLLQSTGWLGRQTVALKVQFTLYSPAPNLFTSVTMLAERSPTGVLLPSAKVQSAQVFHSPATQDYVVMVYQVSCISEQTINQSIHLLISCFSFSSSSTFLFPCCICAIRYSLYGSKAFSSTGANPATGWKFVSAPPIHTRDYKQFIKKMILESVTNNKT